MRNDGYEKILKDIDPEGILDGFEFFQSFIFFLLNQVKEEFVEILNPLVELLFSLVVLHEVLVETEEMVVVLLVFADE